MLTHIKEVKKEVKKVVWPDKKDALKTALIVIMIAAITATAFSLIDMGVLDAIKYLIG